MLIITQTALELGFLYAPVALALFLSYRILDIADLTTDGCFVLGAAVSVSLTAAGHPFLAIPAAMLAGACAGLVTAFLQTRLGVESIMAGIIVNTGLYTINLAVMGFSHDAPDDRQLAQMRELVEDAMQAGALGLSTGLAYAPGRFAATDELAALTEPVGRYGGVYTSHLRDQGDQLEQSVQEAIDIARGVTRNQGSELFIHRPDGRIRARDSHGRDPFPPQG